MSEREVMVKIDHVSKQYRLGAIGGTTLREDLARLGARLRKKDDPTLKIGQDSGHYGEKFLALNDVSFEVGKGEKVQIIHDFASEGYEQRNEYNDFWDWLKDAIDEMIEFNRE